MPAGRNYYAEGPEALIVSLAGKGDRDAFAELVRRRHSWLRKRIRRRCGDDVLADDLAERAFMGAWRRIRRLREPERFADWLRRLADEAWRRGHSGNDPPRRADTVASSRPVEDPDAPAGALDDDFTDRVMARIASRRRRLLGGRLAIAALLVALELLLDAPLQNSLAAIAQVLATPLLRVESGWLGVLLAPINSIAGLVGLMLLALQSLYRRLFV